MRGIFVKFVAIVVLAALLIAVFPMMSFAAGGGSAAGTTGGEGHGTERGAPPPPDHGQNVGTGVTGGEVRDRGVPAQERGVGERRVGERGEGREGGFVGAPVGGTVVYSLTVYNGDEAACYNACIASGQYPLDQCQYMCTQW